MELSLNGSDWQIKGYWPWVPVLGSCIEAGLDLKGVTDWVSAKVPGSIFDDLHRAGIINDPYYEMNSINCEWVSERWWLYSRKFKGIKLERNEKIELVFKGIDYRAHVFFNNLKLGEHEGMCIPAVFDITELYLSDGENDIKVLIENSPEEMSQIGWTNRCKTQKSRFCYKWDFSTRLIHQGIWDDVYIRSTGKSKIELPHIKGDLADKTGKANISFDIESVSSGKRKINIRILDGEKSIYGFTKEIWVSEEKTTFAIDPVMSDIRPWYPNGSGEAYLYRLEVDLYDETGLSDRYVHKFGFRTVSLVPNDDSPTDSLPYTLVVNGKKTYIKGMNLVPLDHFYGAVDRARYRETILMLKECNVNFVRIWGGGYIEKTEFYELCDEHGIMVMQEFMQSSSGLSNEPPVDEDYLRIMESTARHAVIARRNHTSLVMWCGGNELRYDNDVPVSYDNANIQVLARVMNEFDPERHFVPSSASGPLELLDIHQKTKNHDVHGPWKYNNTNYYMIYNESDSMLHSEFGVDGLISHDSMKRFLSDDNIDVFTMENNLIWRHHGEWWDTLDRDTEIFGEIKDIETFILCSQYLQAEGLRYAVEANRRRTYRNSGSIIWQFNEPWPNVSATSLVDYYNCPKLAYYYVKRAFSTLHLSLKYDKLVYEKDGLFNAEIHVHNDHASFSSVVYFDILDEKRNILDHRSFEIELPDNGSAKLADVNWMIRGIESAFLVDLYFDENTSKSNRYLFFVDTGKESRVTVLESFIAYDEF
ncbi:hypothetical protein EOM86_02490 [Candidatus Nomurabacteria bacterium]|nr:hypothetical protein [Candidatus Nomurabacteria bacterium]